MSGLTLRQLEIFVQVVQHGSFRSCAREVGVSPVSVSEHVRALEHRLGRRLFERRPGGAVQLTSEGKQAYERTRDILLDIDELIRSVTGELLAKEAVVSFHPFLSRHLLDGVGRFCERYPDISIKTELSTMGAGEILERVRLDEISLGFMLVANASEAPDTELVAAEGMGIFASHDHPLAKLPSVGAEDIAKYPAIVLTKANPLRRLTDGVLASAGLGAPQAILETDEYGLILTEVGKGRGFVCMFSANGHDAQGMGVVQLPTRITLPTVQVRCAGSRHLRRNPVLRELKDVLAQTYRELGAEHSSPAM